VYHYISAAAAAANRAQDGETALHEAAKRAATDERGAVLVGVLMELVQPDGAEANPSRRARADADDSVSGKRLRVPDAN